MEKKINLIVNEAEIKLRVDIFIKKREEIISRTRIKNLILNKKLKINNKVIIDPSKKISFNDKISLTIPDSRRWYTNIIYGELNDGDRIAEEYKEQQYGYFTLINLENKEECIIEANVRISGDAADHINLENLVASVDVELLYDNLFGYTNFSAIYNQGIIDNLIKSNSNTGVIIKASKYDAYYQQIKKNFFSNYKVISINDLNSENLTCVKTLGNYYKIHEIKNYYFCLPKKESIFKIFLRYLENKNNYKNKNLEPLYIKGHYAEK